MSARGARSFLPLALAIGCAVAPGLGSAPAEGAALADALLKSGLQRINRTSELPRAVAALVGSMAGQPLADPPYLMAGTARVESAQRPHLLFAGRSEPAAAGAPSLWFVHYAPGEAAGGNDGKAPAYHLAVVDLDGEGAIVTQSHLVSPRRAFSIPNLRTMIRQGAFEAADPAKVEAAR